MATVNAGQSIMDFSEENTGAIDHIFIIALANGIGITDDLEGGMELDFPPAVYSKKVLDTYRLKGIHPGNGEIIDDVEPVGIGFMKIGVDFIIR